ncbi:MAG: ribose-5-phosphate isomerase RpiA [Phycisphaeraceae bacterium]|nr:MAG: ribose-5-phosphate isomerase RpiA [Phycisphaeraceae bacterium]
MTEPHAQERDLLAEAAVAEIQSGMIVGLGTGRTAARAILALARRVRDEGIAIHCVPTSHASETTARAYHLPIIDFAMIERVDYLFDGADEVDPRLRMIKGKGGALVRERIVAHASERNVFMVGEDKLVDRLGTRSPLPIAVLAYGLASVRHRLANIGLNGVVRRTLDGQLFLTDNGSLIIDATLEDGHDIESLAQELNAIPGVIDHGLFLEEADEVLVETAEGVTRMVPTSVHSA